MLDAVCVKVKVHKNLRSYSYRCSGRLSCLVRVLQLRSHKPVLSLHDRLVFHRVAFTRTFWNALNHRMNIGADEIWN
jgi:hypothetical protein